MRKEHNTRPCSVEGCEELNYSSSTQCYKHLRGSSDNSKRNDNFSKKYPTPHAKCVYAIKNKEGDILYVGESINSSHRLYEHFNRKQHGTWSGTPFIDIEPKDRNYDYEILWHGDNDMERKIMEKMYIYKYKPKFNKIYKHDSE